MLENQILELITHVRKNFAIVSELKNQLSAFTHIQIFKSLVMGNYAIVYPVGATATKRCGKVSKGLVIISLE